MSEQHPTEERIETTEAATVHGDTAPVDRTNDSVDQPSGISGDDLRPAVEERVGATPAETSPDLGPPASAAPAPASAEIPLAPNVQSAAPQPVDALPAEAQPADPQPVDALPVAVQPEAAPDLAADVRTVPPAASVEAMPTPAPAAADAGGTLAAGIATPDVTSKGSAPAATSVPRTPLPGPPRPGPGRPGSGRPGSGRRTPATVRPTATAGSVPAPSPVAAASSDPSRWGRVDAEGNIYLRTVEGERTVGSWQAGAPEEGLAHFARRFDDLLTEVELLAARLAAGGGDPKQTQAAARTLRGGLAEATVVGDVDGLAARLDDVIARAELALGAARSARDAQRAAAIARKEALAVEAESLAADAGQWKQAGDRFKAILDEWRTIRGIDRKTDELLWKRFSKSRETFNRRRGSHFADLDRQRAGARTRKEELVTEAEKLVDSDDWGPTAARFRDLMAEWKAAGRAQKDADDTLWQRFRAAQDAFFARRSATFTERDAEFVANAAAKKALLADAERIDISEPAAARAALRDLQARWEAIGKVPRDDVRPLDARLRAVEDKVREAADRQWRRTDPEAEARVAQFRDRVAQYEAQAAKARAAGDARRADQASGQAAQWREWLATAEKALQHR